MAMGADRNRNRPSPGGGGGIDGALLDAATALVGGDQEEDDDEEEEGSEDTVVVGEDKGNDGDDLYDDVFSFADRTLPSSSSSLSLLLRQKSRDLLGVSGDLVDLFDFNRDVLTQRGKDLLSRDALTRRSKDVLALVRELRAGAGVDYSHSSSPRLHRRSSSSPISLSYLGDGGGDDADELPSRPRPPRLHPPLGGELPIDRFVQTLSLGMISVATLQSLGGFLLRPYLSDEVASKVLSPESARAVRTVREIISRFEDDHGVVDVFSRYPSRDVIASILALSRLQRAASAVAAEQREMDDAPSGRRGGDGDGDGDAPPPDVELLGDLARYSVFANAAYGWRGGLALSGRLHFGDLKTLVSRTGVREQDVVMAEWRSQTHRPAFFIVRDTARKNLVLCIRGTLSAKDVLTDLCATADDFIDDGIEEERANVTVTADGDGGGDGDGDGDGSPFGMGFGGARRGKRSRAHHGMLEGARGVALAARETVSRELAENPDYDLVIVGHSLGAGTAACLGTMWGDAFPGSHGLAVYAYGAPCVGPIDANPTLNEAIVSVVGEGDPFSNLSLGHLADVTAAISQLCEDDELRTEVLRRTRGGIEGMSPDDLLWCSSKMDRLREAMTAEKFYPPGRIFHMGGANFGNGEVTLREVSAEKFRDLMLHPFMFDLSRHIPNRYEAALTRLWLDVSGKPVLEEN